MDLLDSFFYNPPSDGIEIIYADKSILVVNKPAGLLSVPGRGKDKQDCLSSRLLQDYPDALTVHRLDLATSGVMVFARGAQVQCRLSQIFRERGVEKSYMAVVTGTPESETGDVDLPISTDWPNRPLQKIDHLAGKPSLTHYRLLSTDGCHSRLELHPVTGRTHQLRLHMAAIGHPILGDALYGDIASAPRLLLHAHSLSFAHPISGESLSFVRPPLF